MLIYELLKNSAEKFKDNLALITQSTKINYQELKSLVDKLAFGLKRIGIKTGDKVVIMLPNSPDFVISFFALSKIGAIIVPVNIMYRYEELKHIFEDSSSKTIISNTRLQNMIKELKSNIPQIKNVIISGEKVSSEFISFQDLLKEKEDQIELKVKEDEVAVIIYTNATSGYSLGAMLTHKNLITNGITSAQVISANDTDRILVVLPLFHAFGITTGMLLPFVVGGTMLIVEKFSPEKVLKFSQEEKPTVFLGVPTMFAVLSLYGQSFPSALSSVRACISGGAKLSKEIKERFESTFKIKLVEGYGITECSPVVAFNPLEAPKTGSVGLPFPGVEVQIVDEEGKKLPPEIEGEIIVKGPNVMKGYLNHPEETSSVIKDGYFYTGDLGKKDDEGYIYITGLKKRMIIVGGFNVYPAEIERVANAHPKIAKSKLIGIPDELYGEFPKLVVKPKPKENLTKEEVLEYLRPKIANYKMPRVVEISLEREGYLNENSSG